MHRHVKLFAATVLIVAVAFVVARYQMNYWGAEVAGQSR